MIDFPRLKEMVCSLEVDHCLNNIGVVPVNIPWIFQYIEKEGFPHILIKTKIKGVSFASESTGVKRSSYIAVFIKKKWKTDFKNLLERNFGKKNISDINVISALDFMNFMTSKLTKSRGFINIALRYFKLESDPDNKFDSNAIKVFVNISSSVVLGSEWREVGFLPANLASFLNYDFGCPIRCWPFSWRPLSNKNLELFLVVDFMNSKELPSKVEMRVFSKPRNNIKFLTLKETRRKMEVK